MARMKSISIPITGNSAPLRKELKQAQKDLTAFGKAQAKFAQASALAYGVAGSAAAQFAIDAVKAAIEDQKSQALLAKQLQITTGAREAQVAAVEDYIERTMLATNVTDDQLRPALAQLVRVTGNAAQAQKLLTLAADVSIGSGRELGAVVTGLSRAYMGNYGALTRLGIQIDEAAVQSRGFSAVADELTAKFGGSAAAAMDTAAGRVQNLAIRFDELKETLGTALLPVIEDVVGGFADIAEGSQDMNVGQIGTGFYDLGTRIADLAHTITGVGIAQGFSPLRFILGQTEDDTQSLADKMKMLSDILVEDYRIYQQTAAVLEDQAEAAAKADRMVGYLRDQYRLFSEVTLQLAEDEKKRAEAARSAARDAAAEAAARRKSYQQQAADLRDLLGRALKDSREELKRAKEDADEFGRSLAYSFGVSLAGAYDAAQSAEEDYTNALEARRKAYADLDVAKQGTDLNAYLKAVQDVAAAEEQVTAAQKARVTPAAAFAKQVEDAKKFGANLQTLVGQGLQRAGLQQLLDLGPTAGAEVTSAILAGTAGISVGGLNESLAALSNVQSGLAAGITSALAPMGGITAAQSAVDALTSASIGAPGVGQGMTIVVNAGVGDPVAIGRQVKAVLSDYDSRAGSLIVQGGKKKGKKR